MWNMCLNKHVLHCNENFSVLQEMAVMKQAILGLHSSRGSTSQVNRTSTGVHGPESRLRTSAAQDTSSQVTHRPKPTIFVSWKSLILKTSGNSLKLLLYLPWDDSELLFLSAFSSACLLAKFNIFGVQYFGHTIVQRAMYELCTVKSHLADTLLHPLGTEATSLAKTAKKRGGLNEKMSL